MKFVKGSGAERTREIHPTQAFTGVELDGRSGAKPEAANLEHELFR